MPAVPPAPTARGAAPAGRVIAPTARVAALATRTAALATRSAAGLQRGLLALLVVTTALHGTPAAAADGDVILEGHAQRVQDAGLPADGATTRSAGGPASVAQRFEALRATPDAIAGDLIVTYADARDLRAHADTGFRALRAAGGHRVRPLAGGTALVTADPADARAVFAELSSDPAVLAIEPNVRRSYLAVPNDPSYDDQWSHRITGAERAWDTSTGADPATAPLIAIVDSGIDATHPDLRDNVVASLRSVDGQIITGELANDPCGIGHGTAVAGTAAARGDNGTGVAGVLWRARIIDIALTSPENDCPGGPADADTITAIEYLIGLPERPQVINLSLGASTETCPVGYQAAADRARDAGILIVSSAGNDGSGRTSIPASCDGVISVAATASNSEPASYSQSNPQVDVAAPGGDTQNQPYGSLEARLADAIATTCQPGSRVASFACQSPERIDGINGTSFAAPYVAGALALIRQLAADRGAPLDVDRAEAIIEATAADGGPPGRDCDYGWGTIDLAAAVDAVLAAATPELQPDPPLGTGACVDVVNQPTFSRVTAGDGSTTDAVTQAVAVSSLIPDGQAPYAVLARVDDFADALSGSALGLGLGPLLYTSSDGPLDPGTRAELQRVLDVEGRTPWVYVMGGEQAIPAIVDDQLREMGIDPIRIAGSGREATAVEASLEVQELTDRASFTTRDFAFLAYARDFPDAVAAGQMAAYYGIPVLVTSTTGPLHPDTRAELQRLRPERVLVLGGPAAIDDGVVQEVRDLGLSVERLAGPARVDTAIAIAERFVSELVTDLEGGESVTQPLPVAVNLRPRFNDVLSASLIGGSGNIFLPLDGQAGEVLTSAVAQSYCGFGGPLIVIGGRDTISDSSARRAAEVVEGTSC